MSYPRTLPQITQKIQWARTWSLNVTSHTLYIWTMHDSVFEPCTTPFLNHARLRFWTMHDSVFTQKPASLHSEQLYGRRHLGGSCKLTWVETFWSCPVGSVVSVSDSWPSGCEFNPRLRQLFFLAYFRLSPLQKHVRKVVSGSGKKSCASWESQETHVPYWPPWYDFSC